MSLRNNIVDLLDGRIDALCESVEGKKVAIEPGEFGRFNQNMNALLQGVDVAGIYEIRERRGWIFDQGYEKYKDPYLLLKKSDLLLNLAIPPSGDINTIKSSQGRSDHIHVLSADDPKGLVAPDEGYLFHELYDATTWRRSMPFDPQQLLDDLHHQHRLQNLAANSLGFPLDLDASRDDPEFKPYRHFNTDLIAYQKSILETGYLFFRCPLCGAFLKSDTAYTIYNYWDSHYLTSFVEFRCEDICYYLILGASPCRMLGLYIPGIETIISFIPVGQPSFEDGRRYWNQYAFASWVNDFKRYCLYKWDAVKTFNQSPGKRRPTLVVGFLGVFGHVLHDELAAVEYLVRHYGADALPPTIMGNKDQFDLAALFPELPLSARFQSNSPQRACMDLFHHSLDQELFCFRISHVGRVQSSLCKIIFSVAKAKCTDHFIEVVDASRRGFPVIWITLRTQNRTWIDMLDNVRRVIQYITERYPSAAFVLDGLPDEAENVKRLKALLPENGRIFDATRCSFAESNFWMHFVDFTIQSRGNATAFAVIANKTGVCIGAKTLLPPKTDFHNRADFLGCYSGRENGLSISLIPCETDGSGDIRNYDNLILDWREVADAALEFADAFGSALTSRNKLNFNAQAPHGDGLSVRTASCRHQLPVSSDGVDGKYEIHIPMPNGADLEDDFRLPWPDDFAAEINGGKVTVAYTSFTRLLGEWHRILKPGGRLKFEYLSFERFVEKVEKCAGFKQQENQFSSTFRGRGKPVPMTKEMVNAHLAQTGFVHAAYHMLCPSADHYTVDTTKALDAHENKTGIAS